MASRGRAAAGSSTGCAKQAAGVPGLNIMYEGMQARVTEKLVKHKSIVILKHSPCRVIGWELRAADRLRKDGADRVLE